MVLFTDGSKPMTYTSKPLFLGPYMMISLTIVQRHIAICTVCSLVIVFQTFVHPIVRRGSVILHSQSESLVFAYFDWEFRILL